MERSKDIFEERDSVRIYRVEKQTFRLYKREKDQWQLLEVREFSRDESPKNVDIPVFENDSVFGKEYFKVRKGNGFAEDDISILKQKFLE